MNGKIFKTRLGVYKKLLKPRALRQVYGKSGAGAEMQKKEKGRI